MTAKEVWEKMRDNCINIYGDDLLPRCDATSPSQYSGPCAFDACPLLKEDHDS